VCVCVCVYMRVYVALTAGKQTTVITAEVSESGADTLRAATIEYQTSLLLEFQASAPYEE